MRRVDRSTAEDIAQETFLRAWRKRESYDPAIGPPGPWLFGFAVRLTSHHFRSEKARWKAEAQARSMQPDARDHCDDICNDIDLRAKQGRTAAALAALNQGEYEVVTLRYWADLSEQQIATALGIPRGTVKSRFNSAARKMRAQMSSDVPEARDG